VTNLWVSSIVVVAVAVALGIVRLRSLSLGTLLFSITGAVIGLILGALASVPLAHLPSPYDGIIPVLLTAVLTIVFIVIALNQRQVVLTHIPFLRNMEVGNTKSSLPGILVDTSVIIDGRIADIADAGFVPGRLMIPRFVLAELQNIADSEDAMRRGRGRRGLEVVGKLQETLGEQVEIIDQDIPEIKEVDAKLVALSKQLGTHVLTTDYNLNRVAQIQGVRVLNVNELSNAIRPVVIPGEELRVRVVQPGKEKGQGVGYLPDGTMIVVDNGDKLIGQEVSTEVTRVFQTVAGKMIFAQPKKGHAPVPVEGPISNVPVETAEPVSETKPEKVERPRRRGGRQNGHNRHRQSPEDRLISEVNNQDGE
jgi:uncharacterized protein YacL